MQSSIQKIVSVTNDGHGASRFSFREITLNGSLNWMLSDQQSALNFRLRSSDSQYQSTWHVAGDPTLLIILNGAIEIELRNGESKVFQAGEMFVAEDYLSDDVEFSGQLGHRARVVGDTALNALHLKLAKR